MVETLKGTGPSGFLEFGQNLLVVDYGKIYQDGTPVGFLHEDGLMQGLSEPLGVWQGLKTIEELPGCVFRGIDRRGLQLELPGSSSGPTGGLTYNKQSFNVIFGRIATQDHRILGFMTDEGELQFYDDRFNGTLRKMDEVSQLSTIFQGIKSNGQPWQLNYQRPLHRPDKSYWENEIIRYFEDFDRVTGPQKKYVCETMRLFACTGLLQVVRKQEGSAGLGNVRHGASGATGVRSGKVNLDRDEFEKEVGFYKQFGASMVVPRHKPLIEVRINLVVAHEYGHQLEFCLSQAAQGIISEAYEKRRKLCDQIHPLPDGYEGGAELVQPTQLDERVFVSGYARSSMNEYWAESVAAFAVPQSRILLAEVDPEMHELLVGIVKEPEKMLNFNLHESILTLQTSLRVGGELPENPLTI
ncbi:MAG: hypothetical protein K2W82_07320 [Candidatus Obscuribacterales bacterium]|nr:hypothetical protein [Candidatus Obscuribacterales bacterium]